MSSSNQVHTGRKGHPRLPCNGKAIDAKRDPAKRRWRFGGREQAKHVLGVVTWSAGRVSVVWFEPTTSVPDEGRICHLIQSDVLYRPPEGQPADDTRALGFARSPGDKWFLQWAYHWPWRESQESAVQEETSSETAGIDECLESDPNYGQCLKEQRMEHYQGALRAAGGDPSMAPMIPKVGCGIRFWKKASRLGRIRGPKVLIALRRAGSTEQLDERIMKAALEYRSGPGRAEFGRNFGAARLRFKDGSTKIIKAVNVPRGTHSEEEILGVIDAIRAKGHDLAWVDQIFSERIPCSNCMNEVIKKHIGREVDVFYFLAQAEGPLYRGSKLRRLYY